MNPITILTAISAAKSAIDAAIKVKENFFDIKRDAKSGAAATGKSEASIEILREEISLQNERLSDLVAQVEENRIIIEKQNTIIIEVSHAVKVTAETVKTVKTLAVTASIIALIAMAVSIYAISR